MTQATYYIEVDTYWQHSTSYFVGPFDSRKAAVAWFETDDWTPEDNVWLSTSNCGGDIRDAWRIYPAPLSKTEARAHGLRCYADGDASNTSLPTHIKPQARALWNATSDEETRY